MNLIKSVWDKIKNPKGWQLAVFYVLFAIILAGTLTLVIAIPEQTVYHFVLYPFAAIFFAYFVYSIVIIAPKIKAKIIKMLKKFKFANAMLESFGYRTVVFSIFSFAFNIVYVVFMGVLGILNGSAWYISITIYYLVLSFMKGNVFYSMKKQRHDEKRKAKIYRDNGVMFVFMTVALSGIILLIYTSNMYFEYAGLLIYAIAVYTFYKLTLSIINIFKAKKEDDLYIQNIRNINLANALVSIVVLQVAMFQAFSPENNTSFANALTGAVVSAIILIIGIIMIVRANNILKQEKNNEKEWL